MTTPLTTTRDFSFDLYQIEMKNALLTHSPEKSGKMHRILKKKKLEKVIHEVIKSHDIKAVIFDVDGTLYSLKKLRVFIYLEILKHIACNPLRIQEILTLRNFIRERERRVMDNVKNLEKSQYEWASRKNVSSSEVRAIVKRWIYQKPLKYIHLCRKKEVLKLFDNILKKGLLTAVYSDYPTEKKLKILGLSPLYSFCATDTGINKLKPNPQGLLHISRITGVPVKQCLLIGDRDDRDGECARQAGTTYFIIK